MFIIQLRGKKVGFPCGLAGKDSACNVGDLGSIPGLGRSPGEGKGYPLQYSSLENAMDCQTQSQTGRLSLHFKRRLGLPWWVGRMVKNPPAVWETQVRPWIGKIPWRRHGNPLQYSCLENPRGQRSLAGYSPWGQKELDTTERLSTREC